MNNDCIFCKITAGQLPSTRIYEDETVLAFMDVSPVVKGHVLVIPRTHYEQITQTPEAILAHLVRVVQRVARAQISGLQAEGINVSQANGRCAGQIVPHIHFHVIPRFSNDGHRQNWTPTSYADTEEMAACARKIRQSM